MDCARIINLNQFLFESIPYDRIRIDTQIVSYVRTNGFDTHPKCKHLKSSGRITLLESRAGSNFETCFCLEQNIETPIDSEEEVEEEVEQVQPE